MDCSRARGCEVVDAIASSTDKSGNRCFDQVLPTTQESSNYRSLNSLSNSVKLHPEP